MEEMSCDITDALIFTTICWCLHYNDLCWLGFCHMHRSYQRHHQYRTCLASYLFFMVAALIASSFSWWPEKLGDPPKRLLNIIYKVWIGVLVYNFSERLVWFALYETVSYILEFISDACQWVSAKTGSEACNSCFESLKSDFIHQLTLTLIVLYCLYSCVILNGCLSVINEVWKFIRNKFSKEESQEMCPETTPSPPPDTTNCRIRNCSQKDYDYSSYI